MNNPKPPRIAEFILSLFMRSEVEKNRLGDFEEIYTSITESDGKFAARKWYWGHAFLSIPGLIYNQIYWSVTMLKHYLKTAFRFMLKNKMYSFINIGGLALGITMATLIFLYISYELSYDRFYDKSDRIYRVACSTKLANGQERNMVSTTASLSGLIKETIPEVEHATKILNMSGLFISLNEKTFSEKYVIGADESYFNVFANTFICGNSGIALSQPNSVVLSRSTAVKYFGNTNPLNKTLILNEAFLKETEGQTQGFNLKVTGVIEDIPANSHFHADFIVSLSTFPKLLKRNDLGHTYVTYLLLKEDTYIKDGEKKLSSLVNTKLYDGKLTTWKYWLQPLTDIHLKSDLLGEFEPNGNIISIYIFSIMALLIILIASINFMNLSTARYTTRMKEVGIRKVVGSNKFQLSSQFLFESVFYTLFSFFLSLVVIVILLPALKVISNKPIDLSIFCNLTLILEILGYAILIGLLSGLYPAIFFSSFKPVSLFSRITGSGKNNRSLNIRSGLVILQFTISIMIIVASVIINSQLNYLQNKKLGFDKEQVIIIKNANILGKQVGVFKEVLFKNPNIINASRASRLPGNMWHNWPIKLLENPASVNPLSTEFCMSDYDYFNTLKMEMVKGRFLSKEFGDSTSVVINEQAVKYLNLRDPIGKRLEIIGRVFNIVGIAKDFHFESLHTRIKPAGFMLPDHSVSNMIIRIKPKSTKEVIQHIADTWKTFTPLNLEYTFLDEDFAALYKTEQRAGTLSLIFSSLAVAISLLGLFGLTAFSIERRTKEIAVRKVVGASIPGITYRLSKQFLKWVIIANLIACPIAYYAMSKWLENMYYRIDIEIWMFALAGMISLILAIAVVGSQTIKAAKSNLVERLKYE